MPSVSFSRCLAHLIGCTTAGKTGQSTQNHRQNHATHKYRNTLHHFSFFLACRHLYNSGGKDPANPKPIIPAAGGLVNPYKFR